MSKKANGPWHRRPEVRATLITLLALVGLFVLSLIGRCVAVVMKSAATQPAELAASLAAGTEPPTSPPTPFAASTETPTLPAETELTVTPTETSAPISSTTRGKDAIPAVGTGVIATNLPYGFMVGPWHDNHVNCDDAAHFRVTIYSAEISNRYSTADTVYEVTFWKPDGKEIFRIKPFKGKLAFASSIIQDSKDVGVNEGVQIDKGEYVYVSIAFTDSNGHSALWGDHLYYYLRYPGCHK